MLVCGSAVCVPMGELLPLRTSSELVPLRNGNHAVASMYAEKPKQESTQQVLSQFIHWAIPRWKVFWSKFRADGTMPWEDFEAFMTNGSGWGKQLQLGKWNGDTRRVFELLGDGHGHITTRRVLEARRLVEGKKDVAEKGVEGLRRQLTAQYGSLVRAWRCILDPDARGRCSKTTFIKELRNLGFRGNLMSTWAEITCGEVDRTITLVDLDPEGDGLMELFVVTLTTQWGSWKSGWSNILRAADGRISPIFFADVCKKLGFNQRDAKKIFSALDPHQTGSLTEDKGAFLDFWATDYKSHLMSSSAELSQALAPGSPGGLTPRGFSPGGISPRGDLTPRGQAGGSSPRLSPKSPRQNRDHVDNSHIVPKFGNSAPEGIIGFDAPSLEFEFQIILSKEEYREYLRRRRDTRLDQVTAGLYSASSDRRMGSSSSQQSLSTVRSQPGEPMFSFKGAFSSTPLGSPMTTAQSPGSSTLPSPRGTPRSSTPPGRAASPIFGRGDDGLHSPRDNHSLGAFLPHMGPQD